MSGLYKLTMFITSFIPLWISLIVLIGMEHLQFFIQNFQKAFSCNRDWQYLNNGDTLAIIVAFSIILINMICFLYILLGIRYIKKRENFQLDYKIKKATREKTITSEYLLSYILPLFAFDFDTMEGIIAFLIYFIILGFLCIKNDNVYANLLFELQKYSFYNCEDETGKESLIISKQDLVSKLGNTITIGELDKPIHIEID